MLHTLFHKSIFRTDWLIINLGPKTWDRCEREVFPGSTALLYELVVQLTMGGGPSASHLLSFLIISVFAFQISILFPIAVAVRITLEERIKTFSSRWEVVLKTKKKDTFMPEVAGQLNHWAFKGNSLQKIPPPYIHVRFEYEVRSY